jgi:hypothetical protein
MFDIKLLVMLMIVSILTLPVSKALLSSQTKYLNFMLSVWEITHNFVYIPAAAFIVSMQQYLMARDNTLN